MRQTRLGGREPLFGITMAELYPDPRWSFVFGRASPLNRVDPFGWGCIEVSELHP